MANPNWTKGCPSPNPGGRKKGTRNRKSLIMEELERDGSALAAAIKAKALEGDSTCLSLWLSRLEPLARTRGETIEFEFDATKGTVADQLVQVAQAVADGELTIEQGKQFAEILSRISAVRALNQGGDSEEAKIQALRDMAAALTASGRV